jgi:DNA replicative helicase MCM subunit Mcm2 (Cdc46/Mcm family)
MPKKKIEDKNIEEKIFEIIDSQSRSLSINEIKDLLEKKYEIKISPQIVKRYLLKLKKEGKIIGK